MAEQLPGELMESFLAAAQDETFKAFDDSLLKEIFSGPHRRIFEMVYRIGFECGWCIRERQTSAGVVLLRESKEVGDVTA